MVEAMVTKYQRRREIIVDGLNAIPGFVCQKPQGAFYVFPNITGTGMGSTELANLILEKTGVALLPGNSFGQNGEGTCDFPTPTRSRIYKKGWSG